METHADTKTEVIHLRLPTSLLGDLRKQAKREERTLSWVIKRVLCAARAKKLW